MRCFLPALGAVIAVAGLAGDAVAANPKFPQGDDRRSMGNLRPPRADVPQAAPGSSRGAPTSRLHHPRYHPYRGYYRPYYDSIYRDPYGYDYGWYDRPYAVPYPYWRPPYYVAPLYLPAEELYGPQAVRRFMGWDQWNRPQANIHVIVPPAKVEQPEPEKPNLRGTSPESVATAWKLIGYGDAHFAAQKYLDSYQRYRKAARAAPQLATAYFRQGYALMTWGRYDVATRVIKRGLTLDPDWPRSDFKHDELYGDNVAAKTAHVDALAQAAEKEPLDADLLFLVGVFLHFDGKADRAAVFFKRAQELAGRDDTHIRAFTGQ